MKWDISWLCSIPQPLSQLLFVWDERDTGMERNDIFLSFHSANLRIPNIHSEDIRWETSDIKEKKEEKRKTTAPWYNHGASSDITRNLSVCLTVRPIYEGPRWAGLQCSVNNIVPARTCWMVKNNFFFFVLWTFPLVFVLDLRNISRTKRTQKGKRSRQYV